MDYFNDGEGEAQAKFAAKRDKWFKPVVVVLARLGLTSNIVSALGVAFALSSAALPPAHWVITALLLGLYVLMDGLDGPLARITGTQSQGGSLVDIFSDQVGVVIVAVAATYWLEVNVHASILYSFLYIHVIYLMVICNTASISLPRIFRVKYPYFALYVCSLAIENSLPLNIFHAAFGLYYFVYFVVLFSRVSTHLK